MKQDRAQVNLSLIRDHWDIKLVSILASPGLLPQQSKEIKTKVSVSDLDSYEIEFLDENQDGLSFYKDGNRSTSLKKREATDDGVVGDNDGDGDIDEEDWETEWNDYLEKKYDEAGV